MDTRIDSIENLLSILQGLHRSIKFTAEESRKEISFLDIKLIIENNKIITDLYQKPTDSQQYVHFKSCHPSHTKRNIPFNLTRRYCTIIEKSTSRDEKLGNLKSCLVQQGYPSGLIDNGIKKANSIPIEELRQPKQNNSMIQTLAFVTTYNPRNPDMFQVIRNTISLVVTLNTGNKTFNSGLITSFIHNRPFPFLPSHPTSGHHLTSSLSSHLTGHSFAFVYLTCPFHLLSPLPSFYIYLVMIRQLNFVYICL